MTTGELENQLMEFNEDERFYQQYYNVKQDKWMLEDFLQSLDFNEVIAPFDRAGGIRGLDAF